LFQTALASGAEPGVFPFADADVLGLESRTPLADFATSRGLDAAVKGDCDVAGATLSPSFGVAEVAPLAARKVLLTETVLKDMGFFMVEEVRTWPFSSPAVFEVSAFEASVSDPPLTLTSAEMMADSAGSVSGLMLPSFSEFPFMRDCSGSRETS
jgi:hypothetical protein